MDNPLIVIVIWTLVFALVTLIKLGIQFVIDPRFKAATARAKRKREEAIHASTHAHGVSYVDYRDEAEVIALLVARELEKQESYRFWRDLWVDIIVNFVFFGLGIVMAQLLQQG